jgi:hypothetical protein
MHLVFLHALLLFSHCLLTRNAKFILSTRPSLSPSECESLNIQKELRAQYGASVGIITRIFISYWKWKERKAAAAEL